MIASSTTSPMAITSPAMTIVLSVAPIAVSTRVAAISDSGIAVRLITAVRQSKRNVSRITITSTQPIIMASDRLSSDRSMNVAGRKMVGSISTPFKPGFRSSIAFSTFLVTSSVLPVGCFSTIKSRPSPSLITASPIGGGKPILTSATSPSRKGAPLRKATVVLARSSGSSMAARWRTAIRWLGMSMNPPPATAAVSVTDLTTASSVTPFKRRRSGSTKTWYCRSRWPQMATLATPGIAINRGRIVHLARMVRSICERVLDETPIFKQPAGRRQGRKNDRLVGRRRQPGRLDRQPLLHDLPGRHQVGPLLENQNDRGEPEHRLRTDRLETDRAVECVFQGDTDQALDLLGRKPGRLGLDLDQRGRELGEDVQRGVTPSLDAHDHEHDRKRQDQHPQPQRRGDNPVHHKRSIPTKKQEFNACRSRAPPTDYLRPPNSAP